MTLGQQTKTRPNDLHTIVLDSLEKVKLPKWESHTDTKILATEFCATCAELLQCSRPLAKQELVQVEPSTWYTHTYQKTLELYANFLKWYNYGGNMHTLKVTLRAGAMPQGMFPNELGEKLFHFEMMNGMPILAQNSILYFQLFFGNRGSTRIHQLVIGDTPTWIIQGSRIPFGFRLRDCL